MGWHDRLKEARESRKLSKADLARQAGISYDNLLKYEMGAVEQPRGDTLSKLAGALDVDPLWLEKGIAGKHTPPQDRPTTRDLPAYGTAAGAAAGALTLTSDVVEWLPRPPGLAGVRDAYALFVAGSSMEPRYRPGEVVFIHPHRPLRIGDIVIVQTTTPNGTEAWLKEFAGTDDGHIITRQYNPPAEMRFRRKSVAALHRVMTMNEVLGV